MQLYGNMKRNENLVSITIYKNKNQDNGNDFAFHHPCMLLSICDINTQIAMGLIPETQKVVSLSLCFKKEEGAASLLGKNNSKKKKAIHQLPSCH